MKFRKKIKIFRQLLKKTAIYKFLVGYLVFFLIVAFIIFLIEPSITNYLDSIWYCFVSSTTIGFGDIVVSSIASKILTIILYLYSVLSLALLTALFTQFFIEIVKENRNESIALFVDKLENLDSLSKEELKNLSQKIKNAKNK